MPSYELVKKIHIGSTATPMVEGLWNEDDDVVVNDATGNWTLKDSGGSTVATGAMAYVAASVGNYEGTILNTDTAGLTENGVYYLEIVLTSGSSVAKFRDAVRAVYQT